MTTDFNLIEFDRESHSYAYRGQRLQGVTSVVYKLKPPFDPDGSIVARSAEKAGFTVEQMKQVWEGSRKASMERGSRVHEAIALYLQGKGLAEAKDPFLSFNTDMPEMKVFKALWIEMVSEGNFAHNVEWVVGDVDLGLAGTCDIMVHNRLTNNYHLFDWKTGAKFETANRFQKLLAPFDDLDDCEFNIYSIQLAAYRLMIERNAGKQLGDSYIVHLREDGHQFHKALDLRERAETWLKSRVINQGSLT